jgi:hypothetical protein
MNVAENCGHIYQCDTCLKCFSRKDYLKKHLERKIKCTDTKICYRCNKEFPKRSNLERHLNRKYKCKNINEVIDEVISDKNQNDELKSELIDKDKEIEILKLKLIIKEKEDAIKKLSNNIKPVNQTINNTTNNKNITNNINNTYINYVNNYPNAKNLEDCMKVENVTKEMIKECKDMYLIDGSYYLYVTLLGTDELKKTNSLYGFKQK